MSAGQAFAVARKSFLTYVYIYIFLSRLSFVILYPKLRREVVVKKTEEEEPFSWKRARPKSGLASDSAHAGLGAQNL